MIGFRCPKCHSSDIVCDAPVTWSVPEQRWEVHDIYDDAYCNACDGEIKYVEQVEVISPDEFDKHDATTESNT